MLDIDELVDLEKALQDELSDSLMGILTLLNRTGNLEEWLEMMRLDRLLVKESRFHIGKRGQIIVIGHSDVKAEDLLAIAKQLGLSKDRFELYLDYNDAKKFDFRNLQWNTNYSAVLVGPMPHSGASKGDYSSVITAIESEEGYPPVIRMGSSALKITKSDFKEKLTELIESGKIA